MNLTRKLIRLVDLRMHHFLAGEKFDASRLHRVHSIEELAVDHSHFKTFYPAKRTGESPCF
jgi:hypothetical protein